MATSASSPGRRSNPVLWAGLIVAAFAWVLLIRQSPGMPASMAGPWAELGRFLLLWVVMMAAMMLPSAAPVAVLWTRLISGASVGLGRVARLGMFLGGYLLVGAVAFAALAARGRLLAASPTAA